MFSSLFSSSSSDIRPSDRSVYKIRHNKKDKRGQLGLPRVPFDRYLQQIFTKVAPLTS